MSESNSTVWLFVPNDNKSLTERKKIMNDKVYDYIEEAPEWIEDVVRLFHWSENYDNWLDTPWARFLDLIGYYDYQDQINTPLDYISLDRLARALLIYTKRPTDVRDWLEGLDEVAS